MEPVLRGGVRLAGQLLQFDHFGPGGVTFVSHAHVPLPSAAGQFIASDVTVRLYGDRARRALGTPFGRSFSLGALELCLHPTGHVPGAAALEVVTGRRRMIYAGEIQPAGLPGGLRLPTGADGLILAAPYGEKRHAFPPAEEVLGEIVAFCARTAAAGEVAVLLVGTLGKAQRVAAALAAAGLQVQADRTIRRLAALAAGPGDAPGWLRPDPDRGPPVRLWPRRPRVLPGLPAPHRLALVSGRASDPAAVAAAGADAGFVLSNHPDHPTLVATLAALAPRTLYLLPGATDACAAALREAGHTVELLRPPTQLDLF
jgi:hypothetical protein